MKVLPPQFSVQGPTIGWDFGRGCEANSESDPQMIGERWTVAAPHSSSFEIGWVGDRGDVLVLTVTVGNRSPLLRALEDDGCTWMGLLDGISSVAGASLGLWLIDVDVQTAIAVARSGEVVDPIVPHVRGTWGHSGWAAAVLASGGEAAPFLHEHAALRV
ncbi:MAG: hypothetical protein KDA93_01050 [Planctomycetaceae bacterium]|nr:hypothetical protein [Planctomycetaceae bacterium]